MTVVRTLGKNTLGDNNKMKVAMRDYDMSTHDISTVFRSTIGVGMLVPFCKILCQKGDIIDLNLINKTLSQPTLGPLFGSFKLQHFMFFGGFRLYNSWLHNNRTGIGMKMSDIKLPLMVASTYGSSTKAETNISASALYKYLGWSSSRRTGQNATEGVTKNGVPLIMYLDIFKKFLKTELGQYDLKILDQIRDVILHKKGNETLTLNQNDTSVNNGGSAELQAFIKDITDSQRYL